MNAGRFLLTLFLIFGALHLDGQWAIPAMSPQGPSGSLLSLDPTPDAAARPVPAAATPDPLVCWQYDDAGNEVVVDCLANGIDPAWTPQPADLIMPCPTPDETGYPPSAWLGCEGPTDAP